MAHNCDKDIDTSYSEISEYEDKCYFFYAIKNQGISFNKIVQIQRK